MLLSLNWLKDYFAKSDVRLDPKELAEQLTMRGLAVSSIKRPAIGLEHVVAGRIEKIEKHPNADRLSVTWVVVSEGENAPRLQIVCGAKNISEGDIVPVAVEGAVLPGNLEIKNTTLRGVDSHGMLCSGKELNLSQDSQGILQLPKHSQIGRPLAQLLGSDDTVLEFELTPNRPDCLSVLGLAREIAPLIRTKLREAKPARFRISPHRTSAIVKVEVDDPGLCPRYVARVIDGLKVAESPEWIKQRLQSVGIRSVNNIVDITNFVMYEYGQPLHAFDLRKIESGTIRVSACKAPMDFTLLSGERLELKEGDILIQDGEKPIALAGIMGGLNSQIAEDTTSIVLESAAFLPEQIRKTTKRLGLHTESSKRFERGVDLVGVAAASERAASLLRDSFGGNVYHPPIDTNETTIRELTIAADMRDVRKLTGLYDLTSEQAAEVLEEIGISSHKKSTNILSVRIPSFRLDLRETVDIVEEIARIIGYDAIPQHFAISPATYDRFDEGQIDFENRARQSLANLGLREAIHYSFTSEANLKNFGNGGNTLVRLLNPISEEMKVLRNTLLPSLVQTYLYNKNRKVKNQKLFEVARVYLSDAQEETGVKETTFVSGLISGSTHPRSWNTQQNNVNFYTAKGILESLVRQLTTVFLAFEPQKNHQLFHPNRSAVIKLGLREIGILGEIHPYIRSTLLETDEAVVLFELNLDALKKFERTTVRFKTPSRFPTSEFDIALLVDKHITCNALVDTIRRVGGNLLAGLEMFDVYEGEKIPQDKKGLAFHLSLGTTERTLLDEEAHQLREKITQSLAEKHGAQLRT
ncbi:MAG: phenylalanine--tRNA ligase subunit beta [Deltaproteobacteria bacterium]|nr:phenylalanine--tRNA ligase subunit beta [Deltaproteobacteria bacterium]